MWVESVVGEGSVFHFAIEMETGCAPASAPHTAVAPEDMLEGVRVLVVDDNATNRTILDRMLRSWGMAPTMADGAKTALAALESAKERGEHYRLILTDMHMPGLDGFGLVERLREEDCCEMPAVLMLSSGGSRSDVARCEELGIAAWLIKPVRQAELREAVCRALGSEETQREGVRLVRPENAGSSSRHGTALNILLAEDYEVNQKLVRRMLERRGHRVTVVGSGIDAMKALERRQFDLVLMDIQMPGMGGIEATRAIREAEKRTGQYQPIIAMTALALEGDRERCLAAGMDGYLAKPFRSADLDKVLETVAAAKEPGSPRGSGACVNQETLLEKVDNDREFLAELVRIFCETFPEQLRLIEDAIDNRELEQLGRAAHTLKGALANLTADAAARLAGEVEDAARAADPGRAEAAYRSFRPELVRALAMLEELSDGVATVPHRGYATVLRA
jgi:CheY-like chemotaxis protein/HPt (histidine-containing phosphotransfer) domain-containing protein